MSRVTSQRDATSVHDSHFLRKKKRKRGARKPEEIVSQADDTHTREVDTREMLRANEKERDWTKNTKG